MTVAKMKLADPESVELTLTITLPVHAWHHITKGGNWNPFGDVVRSALAKVREISAEQEVEP